MTDNQSFIVIGPDGVPEGVANPEVIATQGITLAFKAAALSSDDDKVQALIAGFLTTADTAAQYVAARALFTLVSDVLEPCLQILDELHAQGIAPDCRKLLRDAVASWPEGDES